MKERNEAGRTTKNKKLQSNTSFNKRKEYSLNTKSIENKTGKTALSITKK